MHTIAVFAVDTDNGVSNIEGRLLRGRAAGVNFTNHTFFDSVVVHRLCVCVSVCTARACVCCVKEAESSHGAGVKCKPKHHQCRRNTFLGFC